MIYLTKITILWIGISCFYFNCDYVSSLMTLDEKYLLKNQAKEMFYHAYRAYMDHAYPADELMPLSCKGRYRDIEPNRGDVDDALGNFSLTLVDTLDTLVVLGDFDEFERAVKKVIKDVSFDNDVVVSVFETNIRMLGGLLSGHILGSYLQENFNRMKWYSGELLNMAKDLGYRLVPAFNTSTGVPHPRINLRYGLKSQKLGVVRETCTACAGTMILEFAALSRLTGESIFEEKARAAMDYLWQQRHRTSDLMGTVLNIHNGDWIRRDSGVGAGIDSYYEYCLKAYILLGDDVYLERFNKHYTAVMKYVSQGPLLVDVHMHRPHTNSRNFMDALLAFWPGLQVLKGDIKPAIETHEMLYQVMQRHNFLPEAFTTDFQVHWGQHPLRPEFVESTYFLYKATNDPYYLEVGKKVLHSLQTYARVPCGFAAVKDVRTGNHEDRMDSFVLAETLKYLYLLFANKDELTIEVDDFVFTTEAHLLPLSLARISNASLVDAPPKTANMGESIAEDFAHSCPNNHYLFPNDGNFAQTIRVPLKNLVEEVCPSNKSPARTLLASEFYGGKKSHLEAVKKMGITVMKLADGVIQLVHNASMAESPDRAEEGIMFMKEMMERTRDNHEEYVAVYYYIDQAHKKILPGCPAKFGVNLRRIGPIEGYVAIAVPVIACSPLSNPEEVKGKIVFVQRGRCMFIEKARHLQKAGAIAGIVIDDNPTSSVEKTRMFSMDGNDQDDVMIPLVFMFSKEAKILLKRFEENSETVFGVTDDSILEETEEDPSAPPTESTKDPDTPSSKLSDVEFVDSKPSPKSLEPDEFITTTAAHQKPPPLSKPAADPGILSAQKQVQLLLLQKLHHLQQIWTELDRILRDPARLKAYQRVSREPAFHAALERLIRSREEGGGGSLPDRDVQQFLTRLLGLVGSEQKPCFEGRSVSPGFSREAFVAFLGGDRELYDYRFSCAGSQLGIGEKVLEDAVFATRTGVAEDWGS